MAATATAAIVAGLLVTPVIFMPAATLSTILSFFALATLIAAIIATGHVLLLALPIYCLLRRIWRLRWWNAVLAGVLIAALPATLCVLAPDALGNPNGHGVLNLVVPVIWLTVIGACAGLTFWWVAREPRRSSTHCNHAPRRNGPAAARPETAVPRCAVAQVMGGEFWK